MAIPVEMPKMSDTMEEGVLVSWSAEEGQAVSSGDVIAQVETDKATMDLEVYDDGVLLKRVVAEGASVPIGGLIAVLGKEGEDPGPVLAKYAGGGAPASASEQETPAEEPAQAETPAAEAPAPGPVPADAVAGASEARDTADAAAPPQTAAPAGGDGAAGAPPPAGDDEARVKASPLARRMANERGVDLARVSGSGPEGRIVRRDVEAASGGAPAPAQPAAPASAPRPSSVPAGGDGEYETLPISQMRRTIARRLAASKFTSPHYYLTVQVDMDRAVEARERLVQIAEARGQTRVSYNDLVTKACALALRRHPAVNASYLEEQGEIRRHRGVHVAVAVAVDEGLLTPVIRDADQKGLIQISDETRALAERARARKLEPAEWEGSTFTTSNLGMFGVDEFTAIINPPNACILAIGGLRDEAVVRDGAVVPGKRMALTLSCDHRVVDGAVGAAFLADVKALLEDPVAMLL
jgi:pyruvate dehydrogenase E2 component (dihydrolipoamide acetyltransferase)